MTFNREIFQIVELEQPRCANRFGVAPCTASTDDGPRCYQTWATCLDRENLNGDGVIRWRFVKPQKSGDWIYEQYGDDDIATNALPCLVSVSHSASRLNVGAARDGESPFGVRSGVTVRLQEFPWDDPLGDFYRDQRSWLGGNFWAKWVARNEFYGGMFIRVYEGYAGQALAEMQQRLYILDKVDGPDANGAVTLSGLDPLRLTDSSRARFPRATDMALNAAINDSVTSGIIIRAVETDLTDAFGNTATRYLIIGSEVIGYTGQTETGVDTGLFELSGVIRGALGTVASAHSENAAAQRVGRYNLIDAWDAMFDLLTVHSGIPAQFIDKDQWDEEGILYLTGFEVSATVTRPEPVEKLAGELMQQATFYVWWDERLQTIPLKAVRPEQSLVSVNDDANILAGSAVLKRDPEAWFTRIFVYYLQRNPTQGFEPFNFDRVRARVDGEVELPEAGGTSRTKIIYSRWLTTEAQATELAVRLLGRYRRIPRYLSVTMDGKDRYITIGDILTVETKTDVDSEGRPKQDRWQVISADEVAPGHAIRYDLQEFQFQQDRFGRWMASDAPEYDYADEDERLEGGFWTDDEGKMPDGTDGYLWQ